MQKEVSDAIYYVMNENGMEPKFIGDGVNTLTY